MTRIGVQQSGILTGWSAVKPIIECIRAVPMTGLFIGIGLEAQQQRMVVVRHVTFDMFQSALGTLCLEQEPEVFQLQRLMLRLRKGCIAEST